MAAFAETRPTITGQQTDTDADMPTDTAADLEADVEAVLAANRAFYEAFNARDLAAMAALWSRNVEATCIHPHRAMLVGREDVLRSWRAILGHPEQPKIVFAAERPRIVGDIGVVTGREVVAAVPIAATNIYVREDGEWRMIHHHGSPVIQVQDHAER